MTDLAWSLQRIHDARLVPVVRSPDVEQALATVELLVRTGRTVIELTTSTADWPTALQRVRAGRRDVCVGVGTLMTSADAQRAVDDGADFLVTPRLDSTVRAVARASGVPLLEGGATPTEIFTALAENGVAKLFPAHVGGPAYLRSLLSIAPDARIMPTGGIALDDVSEWLAAGAFAVGVGRDLTDPRRVAGFAPSGPL